MCWPCSCEALWLKHGEQERCRTPGHGTERAAGSRPGNLAFTLSEMGAWGGAWPRARQDTTEVRLPLFALGDQIEMGKVGADTRDGLVRAQSDSA